MIALICKAAPVFILLCLAVFMQHSMSISCIAQSITGTILQEDISTSERLPVLMHPFASSSDALPQDENAAKIPRTLSANPPIENFAANATQKSVSPSSLMQVAPTEHLIDQIDVYALSPHAARLALPRMVSPLLVWEAHEGKARLPASTAWESIIQRASQIHGLPPALVAAVIGVESNFENLALSPKGAQGLMQLMPRTQQDLGVVDPYDPEANVMAGCAYLRRQLDAFGSLELALAAYNAGPANVTRYGAIPPFAETQNFVRKVLNAMEAHIEQTKNP